MTTNRRSIGSQGLEQGGPNLGNDYSTPPRSVGTGETDIPIIIKKHDPENKTDMVKENQPINMEDSFEEEETDDEEV